MRRPRVPPFGGSTLGSARRFAGRQSIASHPAPLRHQRHLLRARPTASHASAGPAPSKPYSTAARHASFVAGAAPWRLRLDASGKHASHAVQLCALRADVLETAVCEDTAVDEEAWDPCEELRERLEVRERCVRGVSSRGTGAGAEWVRTLSMSASASVSSPEPEPPLRFAFVREGEGAVRMVSICSQEFIDSKGNGPS